MRPTKYAMADTLVVVASLDKKKTVDHHPTPDYVPLRHSRGLGQRFTKWVGRSLRRRTPPPPFTNPITTRRSGPFATTAQKAKTNNDNETTISQETTDSWSNGICDAVVACFFGIFPPSFDGDDDDNETWSQDTATTQEKKPAADKTLVSYRSVSHNMENCGWGICGSQVQPDDETKPGPNTAVFEEYNGDTDIPVLLQSPTTHRGCVETSVTLPEF